MSHYPTTDSNLPFADYIKQCQTMITNRREDLNTTPSMKETILAANSPFEYYPNDVKKGEARIKVGALLIHGLLDCPFTYREIGAHLQKQGILTRAMLTPGHGTRPSDLRDVTYHDWLQAVRYGIESLKKEVDFIFLIGYSTGAALSIYQALQDSHITGLILLAPAIKLRTPIDIAANVYHVTNQLGKDKHWIIQTKENDYAKYRSVTCNGVKQVSKLVDSIEEIVSNKPVQQPICMILSRQDETISPTEAIKFFTSMHNPSSRLLLYTASDECYEDTRITCLPSAYPDLNIANFSHIALQFSASNPHYGQQGDYVNASRPDPTQYIDGAYNPVEIKTYNLMEKYKLADHKRRTLTYNPDFDNMLANITAFIDDVIA